MPPARRRRVFVNEDTYVATTDARRRTLRAQAHLQRSALFSGQRRVFLAQRRIGAARKQRALKRRLRRIRPKTRFRYFGVFGKRRRRVERRDRLQLMRLAAATRRRVALRQKARTWLTKVRKGALHVQRALLCNLAQASHSASAATFTQRLRLLRGAALKRLSLVTRRYQRRRLLANTAAYRKKTAGALPATSKPSVATNLAVGQPEAPHTQKNRKEVSRTVLRGRLSHLTRVFRPRFGITASISLPFQRTLRRNKVLLIGRSPTGSKRVVEPPQGSRKY